MLRGGEDLGLEGGWVLGFEEGGPDLARLSQ